MKKHTENTLSKKNKRGETGVVLIAQNRTALAGSAIKNYKHKNVRAEYIVRVAGVALDKVRKEPERV